MGSHDDGPHPKRRSVLDLDHGTDDTFSPHTPKVLRVTGMVTAVVVLDIVWGTLWLLAAFFNSFVGLMAIPRTLHHQRAAAGLQPAANLALPLTLTMLVLHLLQLLAVVLIAGGAILLLIRLRWARWLVLAGVSICVFDLGAYLIIRAAMESPLRIIGELACFGFACMLFIALGLFNAVVLLSNRSIVARK